MTRPLTIGLLLVLSTCSTALADGPARRPLGENDAKAGKALYMRECSACHGERGNGKGPAAEFTDPRPRDFTKRLFKIRSTESGKPPLTSDLLKTVELGIPGSAMPSFSFLSEDDRKLIVAYVLKLADLLDEPEPEAIPDPGDGPAPTAALIARGKEIYGKMGCKACHGDSGRGDGPAAPNLQDDEERPIKVRDFTGGIYRGGSAPKDLYKRFVTGMDGSPMPSFGGLVAGEDRWALVHFVNSLKTTPVTTPLPADAIAAGHAVMTKYSCRSCHVLDDGKGGEVGPDFRVVSRKLDLGWVRKFLKDPRAAGKIYPWRVWRMPNLGLKDDEVEAIAKYFAAISKREDKPLTLPDASKFAADRVTAGMNLYVLRCAECHTLSKVIECPPIKQQGPDLINVAHRIDFDWAKSWILDPKKIDPKSRMTVPGIKPDEVESVAMFVWKTSLGAK
ncbi:MAG: c-type cytochrome [Candidatus Wallbacteria bacterium]|nr:c-type cytochrome [Candidatus Wallbacteria bacterium]